MIALRSLWGNAQFKRLSPLEKLIYIYLISHPSITVLGVVQVEYDDLESLIEKDSKYIKACLLILEKYNYVNFFEEGLITFIIQAHWHTLSPTKGHIQKALKEGREAKGELKKIFNRLYIKEDFETKYQFTPPTPEEVTAHALSKGYIVDGKTFVDYYTSNDWYNRNDRKVRNWKATCDKVWCREENKLKAVKDAPEGFEFFYAITQDNIRVYPESWKDGEPMHSNFLDGVFLKAEYELKKNSWK